MCSGPGKEVKVTTSGTHELATGSSAAGILAVNHISDSIQAGTNQVGSQESSTSLYVIPSRYSWDDSWELIANLLVEVRTSREEVLAITYLTVEEYGAGQSFEDAIYDLLTSLSDYYQSAETRDDRLDPSAKEDLAKLRQLIRRKALN